MDITIFLIIFSALTIFYLYLGAKTSQTVSTTHDYFLAGKNLGIWSVTFTLIATQIGGGMLLGTSAEAYQVGIYGILYTLGMSMGFLILGFGLASKLQGLGVATTAQIFEVKYKSIALKKFASILSIATMCGILVGQIVASKNLIVGLGIDNEIIFLAFWAFIIIYTLLGGLAAVVVTDIAQVILIILVFGAIFVSSVIKKPSSLLSIFNSPMNNSFNWNLADGTKLTSILVMPMLFSLIEQDLAQRFFASRTGRVAAMSATLAGTFMLCFACIPIYFGVQAKMLGLQIPTGGSPLIPFLESNTSAVLMAVAVCGILAAITSTADSLLCAISSNIAQDFDFNFGIENTLSRSKIITFVVGSCALGASYLVTTNIIDILVESYAISVSCLLVPILFSLTDKVHSKTGAWYSAIAGLTGFVLFKWYPVNFHQLITIAASLTGYLIGSKKSS